MTQPRLPNNVKWALEDLHGRLVQAKRLVGPLVLQPGDHMPSRSFLISQAAHTERMVHECLRLITEVHPDARKAGGSSND